MHSFFLIFVLAQNAAPSFLDRPSFLDQWIASAKDKIAKEPKRTEGYNDLAMAVARKERETGDASYLKQAEDAVARSLSLAPGNFDARKARVAIRLRQHRYEDALEEAQALNKQAPDDNPMYGFICEAQIALGNYTEAEAAVQRMIDLRQVNGPGMERGAAIRELIGYPEAALDWWNSALRLTPDRDSEGRAFIETQVARIHRETGKYETAGQYAEQALVLVPGYPGALLELARIRMEQDRAEEAVELLRARLKEGPSLEALFWLARAFDQARKTEEAALAGANFEKRAGAAARSAENANALLIEYYTEHGRAREGVELGRESIARRHDLFTLSALAWALLQAGWLEEAQQMMDRALGPGLRDAELFYRAGLIAGKAKNRAGAAKYFKKSLEINANSPMSAKVIGELAGLTK